MNYTYNWYNEPKNQTVVISKDFLTELVLRCINSADGKSQEKKINELRKSGLPKASVKKWLYQYSKGGIEINNLIKICDILKIPYDILNDKFVMMGQNGKKLDHKTFVRPLFPINVNYYGFRFALNP